MELVIIAIGSIFLLVNYIGLIFVDKLIQEVIDGKCFKIKHLLFILLCPLTSLLIILFAIVVIIIEFLKTLKISLKIIESVKTVLNKKLF